jgi:dihydroneopterin aldolase
VSDRIELRALRALGAHGANPGEQDQPQPFEIDIALRVDLSAAAGSDDLADTVDYGSVATRAASIVAGRPHRLLESLAGQICDELLTMTGVEEVEVSLRKLRPPLPVDVASVGVVIARRRARTDG